MLKRINATIVIAMCTAAALIAFAYDQRHGVSVSVPQVTLFVIAAILCVSPAVYALLRCKTCRDRTSAR